MYHGKEKWQIRKIEEYFHLPNEHFKRFLPIFEYKLSDISALSDERILKMRQTAKLINAVMALKHSRDLSYILKNLGIILTGAEEYFEKQGGKVFFHTILIYLTSTTSPKESDFLQSVKLLKPKLKKNVMTLYEQLIEKGKKEGFEETIEKATVRMIRKGFSNELIVEVLDVTEEYVNEIRAKLDAKP